MFIRLPFRLVIKETGSLFYKSRAVLFYGPALHSCAVGAVVEMECSYSRGRKEKREERQRDGFKGRRSNLPASVSIFTLRPTGGGGQGT